MMNKDKNITEIAAQMVIMDAIERGCTTVENAIEYMSTEAFKCSVNNYVTLFKEQIPELK